MQTKEKNQLILDYVFSGHQKIHIYIFALLGFVLLIGIIISSPVPISIIAGIGLIVWVFIALTTIIIKKGFVHDKTGTHLGYFSWGKLLIKEPITLLDRPILTVLKFKRNQKLGFISAANPEFSESFNTFDIYLLNEKHTLKDKVIGLKSDKASKQAINFLTNHLPLRYEVYSPDFD